ncbi:Protein CBG09293 [Caenorhabditis briggsae]|uniref:Protein CBG09293 n=1 Tax=Caenorhabditis briggsae TaxID=6238 RepID=A8X9F6_CAEBR|nr:Protein CBG09293 [Caenorhabditis briggsae]CAP29268.2 Protein CBG09293 [Caenorhabditis briggsae]
MPFFPEVSIFSRSKQEWSQLLYDDREMCSKPGPLGYSISLTTAHMIAAPIYAVAFYTLYSEKSSNFKMYKRYLATHAVSNVIFEFHLSVVMKPVLYLPYPVIRFTGIYNLKYVNGGFTLFVFLLIIVVTCWSIVELFHYRFKLIVDSSLSSEGVKRASKLAAVNWWILIFGTIATVSSLALSVVGLFDQTSHKIKFPILDVYPEILCMSALTLPKTSETGLKPIHLFNGSALFSVIIGSFLCSFMGGTSLFALREMVMQTRASLRTIAMHKSFLISLFCQISVHGIMLGFPIFIYAISVIFNVDGNGFGYVALVIASLHGTMSTLAMIFLNRPLYEVFLTKIWRICSANNVFLRDQSSFISMGAASRSRF